MKPAARRRARGFTLVELVVSLMLIGLLALAAAPLLRLPLAAWSEASLRAELGRAAEAAQTRFALDLQRALPHSLRVRQVGARTLLEFMEVRASGRLRAGVSGAAQACPASCSAAGANDVLEAGCADDCFTTLGPLLGDAAQVGDWVVVGAQGAGVPGGDPWFGGPLRVAGGVKSRLTALAAAPDGQRLQIDAHAYPALPADRRVWLVAQAVTLECDPAGRRLLRHSGYPLSAVQPAAFPAGSTAIVATGLDACQMRYTPAGSGGGVLSVSARFAAAAAGGAPQTTPWTAQYAVVAGR
jgi:prepilin-type N-terminal cleavage/methylation domain-containing protein